MLTPKQMANFWLNVSAYSSDKDTTFTRFCEKVAEAVEAESTSEKALLEFDRVVDQARGSERESADFVAEWRRAMTEESLTSDLGADAVSVAARRAGL